MQLWAWLLLITVKGYRLDKIMRIKLMINEIQIKSWMIRISRVQVHLGPFWGSCRRALNAFSNRVWDQTMLDGNWTGSCTLLALTDFWWKASHIGERTYHELSHSFSSLISYVPSPVPQLSWASSTCQEACLLCTTPHSPFPLLACYYRGLSTITLNVTPSEEKFFGAFFWRNHDPTAPWGKLSCSCINC